MRADPLHLHETSQSTADARASNERSTPRHVAVILDGNRRWAAAHGKSLAEAYQLGAARVAQLVQWCEDMGISYATVWALSQDNLRRHSEQVTVVLDAVTAGLRTITSTRPTPIRLIGALDQLPAPHETRLRAIEAEAAGAPGTLLTVALAYSGRHDIVQAVRALARHQADAGLDDAAHTEQLLGRYLSTAGQPDIDLVIRTSGEQRLSGFMLWQTAHAELYFTSTTWPDFSRADFQQALHWYAHRQRRCGR